MTRRMISTGARLAALALTTTGAFALAACEEHPYPSAAPREATAAPPPDDSTLAGAPTGPGYAPTTRSPAYAPQGYPPAPAMAPGMTQSGPPQGYGPPPPYGPPQPGYPPAPGQRYAGPPEIVTMAPIPNPPERPHRHDRGYGWRYRHHRHHAMYAYGPPIYASRHHVHHHYVGYAPVMHRPAPHRHHMVAPMAVHATASAPARPKAKPVVPARPPAARPQLTQPQALDHRHHHHPATDAATAAAASGGSTNTTGSKTIGANTTGSASEADRYQALQQSLADAFASGAQLTAPAHMEPNQASTVTLTTPADFAQTVRTEAAKQNLSDQAATVNLMASLSGDGYTIVPGEAQSQPLTLNAPTTFTWQVTPTGAGRGALKASVRAAVGEGHDLTLGEKSTGSGAATGRVVGIGLLALIALVLLGWAAQRRRPKVTGASKPRTNHTNGNL